MDVFGGELNPSLVENLELCVEGEIQGCMDENYAEYSALHTPQGPCASQGSNADYYCEVQQYGDGSVEGECQNEYIQACTDPNSYNYYCNAGFTTGPECDGDVLPTVEVLIPNSDTAGALEEITLIQDDGSCDLTIGYGCLDESYAEYHENHIFYENGYTNEAGQNAAMCEYRIFGGCLDPDANNFWCTSPQPIVTGKHP